MTADASTFKRLRGIDVSRYIEKKGKLNYISWAAAVDLLLQEDPSATWEYREPVAFGKTLMVFCTVTAFGKSMTAQLPVMNHRNQAIEDPDAFEVNTAMQRCLAKAIALHGIGLSIYAGEDLLTLDEPLDDFTDVLIAIREAEDMHALKTIFTNAKKEYAGRDISAIVAAKDKRKEELTR